MCSNKFFLFTLLCHGFLFIFGKRVEILEPCKKNINHSPGCSEYSLIESSYETPYLVTCGQIRDNIYYMKCSGSIVSDIMILTARSCAQILNPDCNIVEIHRYERKLYYSVSKWYTTNEDEFMCSKGFGLLQLNQSLQFDHEIRPACLSHQNVLECAIDIVNMPGTFVYPFLSSFNNVPNDECQLMLDNVDDLDDCTNSSALMKSSSFCINMKSKVGIDIKFIFSINCE